MGSVLWRGATPWPTHRGASCWGEHWLLTATSVQGLPGDTGWQCVQCLCKAAPSHPGQTQRTGRMKCRKHCRNAEEPQGLLAVCFPDLSHPE